jgi:hypothetical protein
MYLIKTIGYDFMAHPLKMIWLLMVLALLMPMRQVFATTTAAVSDIRILIDVSGSMKKNDPNNLRAPALRLLVGLLPNDAKAGTWTFGQYVNMLVPFRDVNDAWKVEAELQSKNIHSYGLFTNIEQALNKATANQKGVDPRYRRSVILLSDGLVDVSKDDEINKKSRQRILDIIVPRLKRNNVAVHTVALSDSADHNLLRAISLATDGGYEQVDNAEQLQRVFLHLFEKAASRDTVPLEDNQFKIDNSVKEMTLLVFRSEGAKMTELLLPNQSRISEKNMANNVRWHSEGNYDLITIDKPLVGQWHIDAEIDPDNRVMVVTDLKLQTTDLPNNILIGETFDFDVSLTDKDKLIVRQDFLKLVDAQLKEESDIAEPIERNLNAEQKKGLYRTHVGENFKAGPNDVVITMISATFERQRRQSINVVETPFEINVEQLKDQPSRTHRLTLRPDVELIQTDKLSIAAMLTAVDGSEWSYEVMKVGDNEWQLTLADLQVSEKYTVALQIRAETVKGRPLFLQPALIELRDELAGKEAELAELAEEDIMIAEVNNETSEQTAVPEIMPETKLETIEEQQVIVADNEVEKILAEPVTDEMSGNLDNLLPEVSNETPNLQEGADNTEQEGLSPAIKLAIGNGLILLMIGLGVFFWRRKSAMSTNPGEQL